MYKIIIAGGRHFNDYSLLSESCDKILAGLSDKEVIIVSGNATGADYLGERYAAEHGLQTELHPAGWKIHGKAAGPIRNKEMAKVADALIAFWDGQSRGTKSMIDLATRKGLSIHLIRYTD